MENFRQHVDDLEMRALCIACNVILNVYAWGEFILFRIYCDDQKKTITDNQWFMRKMMFFDIFYAKIFGQFIKKQYLCSRFRAYCK